MCSYVICSNISQKIKKIGYIKFYTSSAKQISNKRYQKNVYSKILISNIFYIIVIV